MNYRNFKTVLLIFAMAVVFGTFPALAEEEKPTASAEIGVFSKYMWRGYELSDDSLVIQPSVTVGYKKFSFNLWGNIDTSVDDMDATTEDENQWNETDLTLSYSTSSGPFSLEFGWAYYGMDALPDTSEIYASVGYDAPLSPTFTIYKDIGTLPAWYLNFGLSHSIELRGGITLDLAGSVGYYISSDDTFVEVDNDLNPTNEKYSGFHDGNISAGLTIPLDKYFTISPMVAYSFPLTNDADNLLTSTSFSNDSDFVYGGVTLSITF